MKIENQICSFKQAIRLKGLGIVQHSLFYYVNNWATPNGYSIDDGHYIVPVGEQHITRLAGRKRGVEVEFVSAFTVMELGQLLPHVLPSDNVGYGMVLMQSFPDGKEQDYYMASYVEVYSDLDYGGTVHSYSAELESVSRAGLLLDLIEKKVIRIDDINSKFHSKENETF